MEGHAPYIECRACMNSRSSPAGLRVARWMRRFRSRYQALSPDVMVNAQWCKSPPATINLRSVIHGVAHVLRLGVPSRELPHRS